METLEENRINSLIHSDLSSVFLSDDLGERDVLACIGGQRHPQVDDLLGGAAHNLVLGAIFLLLLHPVGVDPGEVGSAQLLSVLLSVSCKVTDSTGATFVDVRGTSLRHGATDGSALRAGLPFLPRWSHNTMDCARVPNDQVARLWRVPGLPWESGQVAILEIDKNRVTADRLIAMRSQQIFWSSEPILATGIHGNPPTDRIFELNGAILVVLVPTKAAVGVH
mmetsp:Transcript_29871/g.36612  ORF Transcript_29871/g.36612 Transcript_29871/m.36612 type:complete len:223 (+) Transcript_29871:39-707(+)